SAEIAYDLIGRSGSTFQSPLRAEIKTIMEGIDSWTGDLRMILVYQLHQGIDVSIRSEYDYLHVTSILSNQNMAILGYGDIIHAAQDGVCGLLGVIDQTEKLLFCIIRPDAIVTFAGEVNHAFMIPDPFPTIEFTALPDLL